jgi:hypothetical protein
VKLRDFTLTTNELPPTNVYVLGYWEGEPGPFIVVRRDHFGIWWSSDPEMTDDYIQPVSWSYLPGGRDINTEGFVGSPLPDLDAEV